MKSNFIRTHLGWIVTGFLTLLFWIQTCNLQRQIREGHSQITQLQLDKQTQDSLLNNQGQVIRTQDAIIVDNTRSLSNLTDTIFDLKRKDARNTQTIAYFKEIAHAKISQVLIPYLDSVGMHKWADSLSTECASILQFIQDSTIQVPRTATLNSPNYSIDLTARKEGININALVIPDTLQLRFVEHKSRLFKRGSTEVQYFHTNPTIQSLGSNSVIYKPKPKPRWLEKAIIVGVGIFIGSKL